MRPVGAALAVLTTLTAGALGYQWLMRLEVVKLRDPCRSFIPASAPSGAPRIERRVSGSALVISFSPTPSAEVDRIVAAARLGKTMLEIRGGIRITLSGLSDDGRGLVIPVETEEQAQAVQDALCVGER